MVDNGGKTWRCEKTNDQTATVYADQMNNEAGNYTAVVRVTAGTLTADMTVVLLAAQIGLPKTLDFSYKAGTNRYAYLAGYFDFDMKVSGTEPMKLMMTFWGGDCGRDTFEILVNGELLQLFTPKGEDGKFVENTIAIPEKYTQGKDKIRISFKGREKNRVTSLYDCRMMR